MQPWGNPWLPLLLEHERGLICSLSAASAKSCKRDCCCCITCASAADACSCCAASFALKALSLRQHIWNIVFCWLLIVDPTTCTASSTASAERGRAGDYSVGRMPCHALVSMPTAPANASACVILLLHGNPPYQCCRKEPVQTITASAQQSLGTSALTCHGSYRQVPCWVQGG